MGRDAIHKTLLDPDRRHRAWDDQFFAAFAHATINRRGQVAFDATLTDRAHMADAGAGIWRTTPDGALELVILAGDVAPGTNPAVTLASVQLMNWNDAGHVTFQAYLSGGGRDGAPAYFVEHAAGIREVVLNGEILPGTPHYAGFIGMDTPAFNNAGQTIFYASTTDGYPGSVWRATPSTNSANVELVARPGQFAPGTIEVFDSVVTDGRASLNEAGATIVRATLAGPEVNGTNNSGIWAGAPGLLGLIARAGDRVPGLPADVFFGNLINASSAGINNRGHVTFLAELSGNVFENEAICATGPAGLRIVARTGQHASGTPNGVVFSSLFDPVINDGGRVIFHANLSGPNIDPGADQGVWAEGPAGLRLIAHSGGALPGVPGSTSFPAAFYGINDNGQTFIAGGGLLMNGDPFTGVWVRMFSNGCLRSHCRARPSPSRRVIIA